MQEENRDQQIRMDENTAEQAPASHPQGDPEEGERSFFGDLTGGLPQTSESGGAASAAPASDPQSGRGAGGQAPRTADGTAAPAPDEGQSPGSAPASQGQPSPEGGAHGIDGAYGIDGAHGVGEVDGTWSPPDPQSSMDGRPDTDPQPDTDPADGSDGGPAGREEEQPTDGDRRPGKEKGLRAFLRRHRISPAAAAGLAALELLLVVSLAVLLAENITAGPDGETDPGSHRSYVQSDGGQAAVSTASGGQEQTSGEQDQTFTGALSADAARPPAADDAGVYLLGPENIREALLDDLPAYTALRQDLCLSFWSQPDGNGNFAALDPDAYVDLGQAGGEGGDTFCIYYHLDGGVYTFDSQRNQDIRLMGASEGGRAMLLRMGFHLLLFRPEEGTLCTLTPEVTQLKPESSYVPIIANEVISPDGRYASFSGSLRKWAAAQTGDNSGLPENELWVVDLESGRRKVVWEGAPLVCSLENNYLYFCDMDTLFYYQVNVTSGELVYKNAVQQPMTACSIKPSNQDRLQGHFSYNLADSGLTATGTLYNLENGGAMHFQFNNKEYSAMYYCCTPRISTDGRWLACLLTGYAAEGQVFYVGLVDTTSGDTTLYKLPAGFPNGAVLVGMDKGTLLFRSGKLMNGQSAGLSTAYLQVALGALPGGQDPLP